MATARGAESWGIPHLLREGTLLGAFLLPLSINCQPRVPRGAPPARGTALLVSLMLARSAETPLQGGLEQAEQGLGQTKGC